MCVYARVIACLHAHIESKIMLGAGGEWLGLWFGSLHAHSTHTQTTEFYFLPSRNLQMASDLRRYVNHAKNNYQNLELKTNAITQVTKRNGRHQARLELLAEVLQRARRQLQRLSGASEG